MMGKVSKRQKTILKKIYYNAKDSGGYGGVERLLNRAKKKGLKINKNKVIEFLKNQDTYTLHKNARRRFSRNKTIVKGIDHQWQADLADLNDIVKYNDGYRYLLTVIDCFSKFGWAIPIKRKDADTLVDGFKTLFKESSPRLPERLQTDKGKEFLNSKVQELLRQNKIHHFVTQNETKAAMVERFNRTLKTKMFTYFTANKTYRYLEVLPKLLYAYNHSTHRTIGMQPAKVEKKDEQKLWHKMYGKDAATNILTYINKFIIGDVVRISKVKSIFEKGYLPNWSSEVFKIIEVVYHPHRVYKLEDYDGSEIAGTFYPEEIQKVYFKLKGKVFDIEKIIRKRKVAGKLEYFVKWKGWPKKFNSWVLQSDLNNGSK